MLKYIKNYWRNSYYRFMLVYFLLVTSFLSFYYDQTALNLVPRVAGIFSVVCYCLLSTKGRTFFGKYIFCLLIFFIFEMFVSSLRYSDDIIDMILFNSGFFSLLAYFILIKIDYHFFLKGFCSFISLGLSLMMIQYVIYLYTGKILFFDFADLPKRMDSLRIFYLGGLSPIVFIISSIKVIGSVFLHKKIEKIYLFSSLITFIDIVYILMTRSLIILCFVVLFLILIFVYRKSSLILKLFFVLLVLYFLGFNQLINQYVNFNADASNNSMVERNMEISYYLSETITKHILLGFGYVRGNIVDTKGIIEGPYGTFYREDVGLVGFFHTYGLVGMIFIFYMFFKILRIIYINRKVLSQYTVPLGVFLLFVAEELTVIDNFYYSGISNIPIILVLIENGFKIRKNENNYSNIRK